MSITATYSSRLSVIETIEGPFVSPTDPGFTTDQLSLTESKDADTTVPVTKHVGSNFTLSSGTATINLAAVVTPASGTVDMTGLKLQYMKLRGHPDNANVITAAKGASNGYGLGPTGATWTFPLGPDQEITLRGDDGNPDVASGARTIDITGTGAQVLQVQMVFG